MSVNLIDPAWPVAAVDLHQHLWPEALVDRLRARSRFPYLRGWTLHTQGEAPYEIDPAHHVVADRLRQDAHDGIGLACVSLSAPLGIESLRGPSARALLDAWHEGAAAPARRLLRLGLGLVAGAGPDALAGLLDDGFVGVQVPGDRRRDAGGLGAPGSRCWPSPRRPDARARAPGPGRSGPARVGAAGLVAGRRRVRRAAPGRVVGLACRVRARFPPGAPGRVRGGCGAGPVHHERHVARGGTSGPVDPLVHVDTSSYGPRPSTPSSGCSASTRSCSGVTGRTQRRSTDLWGDAATRAVRVTNPRRVLGLPVAGVEGVRSWPRAS